MNKTLATLTAGALATSLLAGCAADGNGGYTMTESGRAKYTYSKMQGDKIGCSAHWRECA